MGILKTNQIQPLTAGETFSIRSGNGTENIIITAGGSLGIGIAPTTSAKLEVNGWIRSSLAPVHERDLTRKDYTDSLNRVGSTLVFGLSFGRTYDDITLYPMSFGFLKDKDKFNIRLPEGTWHGTALTTPLNNTMGTTAPFINGISGAIGVTNFSGWLLPSADNTLPAGLCQSNNVYFTLTRIA